MFQSYLFFCFIVPLIVGQNISNSKCISPDIKMENSGSWDGFPSRESVEINTEVGISRAYFNCTSSQSPVDWILDIHPVSRDTFRFTRSFYQKTFDILKNESIYSSYIVLLYKPLELKYHTLFMCQDKCGGRKFLEISPGKFSAIFQKTEKPSTENFRKISEKLILSQNQVEAPNEEKCIVLLIIKVAESQNLHYKWETLENDIKIFSNYTISSSTTTDQSVYFRNVFRSVKQKRNCYKILGEREACENCLEIKEKPAGAFNDEEDESESHHLNSAAFYARYGSMPPGERMAFRGLFSITKPRRFYFDWQIPEEEMMEFDPPEIIYFEKEVLVKCSVSSIYFAYGTLIYVQKVKLDLTVMSTSGEIETWKPDGRREVETRINFIAPQNETYQGFDINLICSAPLWNWSKRVEKSVKIYVDYHIPPLIDGPQQNSMIFKGDEENVTLQCSATGKPKPTLKWIFPKANMSELFQFEEEKNESWTTSWISIPKLSSEYLGNIICVAENDFGNYSKSWNLQIPPKGLTTGQKAGISSGLAFIVIIGSTSLLLLYRKIIIQRREYRTKTAEAIKEFKEGIKSQPSKNSKEIFHSDKQKLEKEEKEIIRNQYENDYHLSILELPYNDRYEVDRDKWEIDDIFLGQGAFGFVRKGAVKLGSPEKNQIVAIKMLKSSVDIDDFKGFLTELKIMAYIGQHPNVVSLVAACSQNIEERDVMIGVEFCTNGSLMDYLHEKRSMYQPNDGNLDVLGANRRTYANLANSICLTELDLYKWSYQIANGMEFLAGKKVLHGDLATRNVLLTLDKTAKISDFGLSRVLLDCKNYTKKSRVPLPWKWMALESLKALEFSSASDVWSYGVTLFEIFSLGEVPYAGLSFGPEFISSIENGYRLSKPELATDYLYNIMKHCWNPDVESRVNFTQLKSAFSELLEIYTNPGQISNQNTPRTRRAAAPNPNNAFSLPVPQPRRNAPNSPNTPWYSNRPTQIPNLYLNM